MSYVTRVAVLQFFNKIHYGANDIVGVVARLVVVAVFELAVHAVGYELDFFLVLLHTGLEPCLTFLRGDSVEGAAAQERKEYGQQDVAHRCLLSTAAEGDVEGDDGLGTVVHVHGFVELCVE